ncbi:MAG: alpha/beta hydrolase [Actinomycetota bacterium]
MIVRRLAFAMIALVVTSAGLALEPSAVAAAQGADGIRIRPCWNAPEDLCGRIEVPLFWDRPDEGAPLSVRFRVFTRSDPNAPARSPIVAIEGGPGYGSIGSNAAYRFLFAPLLRDRDLILMDQRGTGGSGAIDCRALQNGIGNYTGAVAECAEQLGDAANAYGSAAAADDLEAILGALGVPEVVVYGDSYGTYLAQVFAIRHPELTEAVVLDAAFDDSFDPFARDAAAALKRSWATLCRRAGTCRGIVRDISQAARRLERRPLVGTGIDSSGAAYRVRLTGSRLAQLLYDATYVFTIYRDFPAALKAFEAGDPVPLLRLAAEDQVVWGGGGDPRWYSEGAYAAIACHDYPTIWDRSASVPERRRQLEDAIVALAPDAFSPFPNDVWLSSLYEDQLVHGCLRWPAPGPGDSPTPTIGPHSDVPVLVLDGELDVTTPLVNASDAAAAWPDATFVPVANEIHVSALYDYERCASRIVRRFVRTLDAGDTSCASQTPPINVVESFPARVADAPQARRAGPADGSTAGDRRVAWVVVETIADAFNRWWNELFGGTGVGLHGGSYRMRGPFYSSELPLVLTFHETRFVADVAVSGKVVWRRGAAVAVGRVRVEAPGVSGTLRVVFDTDRASDVTIIRGRLDGRRIELRATRAWTS